MDDIRYAVDSTEPEFVSPPPPRFDETANANAQPVRPIPTSRVSVWIQRAHDARQMLSARTRAVALVLVGGLAIGTLGGTLLAKKGGSAPDAAPAVQESTAETTVAQDASKDTSLNNESSPAQVSAMALQSAGRTSPRIRRHRNRPPVQRSQQAYRVGVIK